MLKAKKQRILLWISGMWKGYVDFMADCLKRMGMRGDDNDYVFDVVYYWKEASKNGHETMTICICGMCDLLRKTGRLWCNLLGNSPRNSLVLWLSGDFAVYVSQVGFKSKVCQ